MHHLRSRFVHARHLPSLVLVCLGLLIAPLASGTAAVHAASTQGCTQSWTVPSRRLKDQTVFSYGGMSYIAAISNAAYGTTGPGETAFAYARTADFCSWEQLGSVLTVGPRGTPDEQAIWAPYVLPVGDTFYMFYTGVNRNMAQSIMVATTTDPSNPLSWIKQGVVFQPHHPGMVYPWPESWADARDPMVLPYNNRYYLYYTGADTAGGIVGVAVADFITGPWSDVGSTLRYAGTARPESPFVIAYGGSYYLYVNHVGGTPSQEEWQVSSSPLGPWQAATAAPLGWADDFFQRDTTWYASYVVGAGSAIGFTPITWDSATTPARPQIGQETLLPYLAAP